FDFSKHPLKANNSYILEFSFSGINPSDTISLATAFGKYANLQETVTQYQFQNNSLKQTDTRHGNISLTVYYNPSKNHFLSALKIFILPVIIILILMMWATKKISGFTSEKIKISRAHIREYALAIGISLVLAAIATLPLYQHFNAISNHGDINRALIYNGIAKNALLSGHLPQWNQYICGGSPLVGDLESWFLQPFFLLTLPFSELHAFKITYTLVLFSCFVGFYALAKIILRLRIASSYVFAIIMAFSGYISAHLAEGYYVWIASAFIPWFLLFTILALKNFRFVILAGLMLAFMFGSGSMHLVVYSILFSSILFLFQYKHIKISQRYAVLFFILCFFVLFSAIKLLPAFSVLTANSSRDGFVPAISLLPSMLLGRGLPAPVIHNNMPYRFAEFNNYVGYGVAVLALIGLLIARKEFWKQYMLWMVASVVILIIAFLPLPITHGFISHITDLFRMPSRVMLFALFPIGIFAGYAVERIRGYVIPASEPESTLPLTVRQAHGKPPTSPWQERGAARLILVFIIIAGISIDLISNDYMLFSRTFTVPMPELHQETNFQRVSHAYTSGDETYYRAIYIDYLENRGTSDVCRFYQAGPFSRAIDETDPRYVFIGEVALQDISAGTVTYNMNSRSEYSIHANISSPTQIIINQNYYPGWKASNNLNVINSKGRIGIPINSGVYDISLKYRPNTVYWGIWITMFALMIGILGSI
ncbi:MAG: hypothetical protein ABIP54_01885, partial [Candidatus Andersenbacteria bacterium]